MPFCPECRAELQDWVKTCPDCGADVVTELPDPDRKPRNAREPLVHIANAPNEPTARMWMGLLENNGIQATMKGGHFLGDMSANSPFLPCEIYVLESDAAEARHFIPREALRD